MAVRIVVAATISDIQNWNRKSFDFGSSATGVEDRSSNCCCGGRMIIRLMSLIRTHETKRGVFPVAIGVQSRRTVLGLLALMVSTLGL